MASKDIRKKYIDFLVQSGRVRSAQDETQTPPKEKIDLLLKKHDERIKTNKANIESIKKKSERLEWISFGVLLLAIIALFAIIFDISKDISRYDSLGNQITELNQNISQIREEILDYKMILHCLEIKDKKYWEYPECFK